jgi:hypothetical protein
MTIKSHSVAISAYTAFVVGSGGHITSVPIFAITAVGQNDTTTLMVEKY